MQQSCRELTMIREAGQLISVSLDGESPLMPFCRVSS